MRFETPNLGKQFEITEAQIRNGQDIDISHLSNESLLFCLQEAVIKKQVVDEMASLLLNEAESRGLIDE